MRRSAVNDSIRKRFMIYHTNKKMRGKTAVLLREVTWAPH
jgi:hypothetical protein